VFQTLTVYSEQSALILMGLLLVGTVLFAPKGLIASLGTVLARPRRRTALPASRMEGAR
jgi:urea transport system permease protein